MVWVGYKDNESWEPVFSRLADGQWTSYTTLDAGFTAGAESVFALAIDGEGMLWVGHV